MNAGNVNSSILTTTLSSLASAGPDSCLPIFLMVSMISS